MAWAGTASYQQYMDEALELGLDDPRTQTNISRALLPVISPGFDGGSPPPGMIRPNRDTVEVPRLLAEYRGDTPIYVAFRGIGGGRYSLVNAQPFQVNTPYVMPDGGSTQWNDRVRFAAPLRHATGADYLRDEIFAPDLGMRYKRPQDSVGFEQVTVDSGGPLLDATLLEAANTVGIRTYGKNGGDSRLTGYAITADGRRSDFESGEGVDDDEYTWHSFRGHEPVVRRIVLYSADPQKPAIVSQFSWVQNGRLVTLHPRRTFPRDDGLSLSTRREFPPPRIRHSGGWRRGPGTIV